MKLITGRELARRLEASPPLIEHLRDPETQIQMDGVDFTLREVSVFRDEAGAIDFDNSERRTPETEPLAPDDNGWWMLKPGPYWVVYNEIVNIPHDAFAFARTRSSLLRSGASVKTALWDSGYSGRSGSLLVVENPAGLRLRKDARIIQLIFFGLDEPAEKTYAGLYQDENK
ncbi:MAG: deoxyuridine 5'-triphosphate nucleotidohydrolase [Vicinamibacteria bacterium]